ncbi:CHASE2 domain-containing protein [Rhodocytophaga aerolata]
MLPKKLRQDLWSKHNFLCTLFIFAILGMLSSIPIQSDVLNPVESTFDDFELTDIVFSKLRPDTLYKADTNIVLVNIGRLNRAGIAEQINIINQYKPKVIGIDAAFRTPKSLEGDTALAHAMARVDNLVLVSGVHQFNKETNQYDTLETSHPMFTLHGTTGFANLIVESDDYYKSCRSFSPKENVRGHTELAFPVKVAQVYQPSIIKRFLQRDNAYEYINYRGNFTSGSFYAVDVAEVFDPEWDGSFLKDKIVLMGYMGENFQSRTLEDKLYTPLNENYVGKAHPDMYGVVVHANSISMILREEYINDAPTVIEIVIAVVLCFLNVVLFTLIMNHFGDWYDSLTIIWQLMQTCIIMYVVVALFYMFNLKINLTLALAAVLLSSNALELYYHIVLRMYNRTHFIKFVSNKSKKQVT